MRTQPNGFFGDHQQINEDAYTHRGDKRLRPFVKFNFIHFLDVHILAHILFLYTHTHEHIPPST